MFLKNQKGETLVEVVVSMVVLVVIIASASSIIMYSVSSSEKSLDLIKDINEQVSSVVNNNPDSSKITPFLFNAEIGFVIKDDAGFTIKSASKYKIAENAPAFATKGGIISFD